MIGVAEEILHLAAGRFGPLGEEAHLTLAEHLAATVDRVRQGMPIPNPFLAQIQLLYPEEYELAGQAVEMIAARLGVPCRRRSRGSWRCTSWGRGAGSRRRSWRATRP